MHFKTKQQIVTGNNNMDINDVIAESNNVRTIGQREVKLSMAA